MLKFFLLFFFIISRRKTRIILKTEPNEPVEMTEVCLFALLELEQMPLSKWLIMKYMHMFYEWSCFSLSISSLFIRYTLILTESRWIVKGSDCSTDRWQGGAGTAGVKSSQVTAGVQFKCHKQPFCVLDH